MYYHLLDDIYTDEIAVIFVLTLGYWDDSAYTIGFISTSQIIEDL